MSEERSREPSPRRRQEAREQGQVARSGELTAAVGLLAMTAALGVWGDDLAMTLVETIRTPWLADPVLIVDLWELVDRVRGLALALLTPLLAILGAVVVATLAAHLAQVGILLSPHLLVPDLGRLWRLGKGDAVDATGRGAWGLVRMALIFGTAVWVFRSQSSVLAGLSMLDPVSLSRGVGAVLRGFLLRMSLVLLILGLVDLAWQHRRFADRLRATPEQDREDRRSAEGDPALRSRRRRVAEGWRNDPVELSTGPRKI